MHVVLDSPRDIAAHMIPFRLVSCIHWPPRKVVHEVFLVCFAFCWRCHGGRDITTRMIPFMFAPCIRRNCSPEVSSLSVSLSDGEAAKLQASAIMHPAFSCAFLQESSRTTSKYRLSIQNMFGISQPEKTIVAMTGSTAQRKCVESCMYCKSAVSHIRQHLDALL